MCAPVSKKGKNALTRYGVCTLNIQQGKFIKCRDGVFVPYLLSNSSSTASGILSFSVTIFNCSRSAHHVKRRANIFFTVAIEIFASLVRAQGIECCILNSTYVFSTTIIRMINIVSYIQYMFHKYVYNILPV